MSTEIETPAVSKKALWAGRIISALPVLLMCFGAVYAAANPAAVKADMQKYGYPEQSVMPIIIVEMACILIYVIPQTAVLGAILLTGYLGGAVSTHVRMSEASFFMPVIVGVLIWLGLLLRDARLRSLLPFRR